MRFSIIFSLLLAVTFVAATPLTIDWTELEPAHPTDEALQKEWADNKKTIEDSVKLADEHLDSLHAALQNPEDPTNKQHLQTAFGPGVQGTKLNKIKESVASMKAGEMKIKSVMPARDADGNVREAEVWSVPKMTPGGGQEVKHGNAQYSHLEFGSRFFTPGKSIQDQAGHLLHESNHYFVGGEDDVVGGRRAKADLAASIKSDAAVADHPSEHTVQMLNTGFVHDRDWDKAGYAKVNDGNGGERYAMHGDIIENGGAALEGTKFAAVRDHVPNIEKNPDSFRVAAALTHHEATHQAGCARSLYKRALTQDDPIGYYLAKRQMCSLPPDTAKTAKALPKSASVKATPKALGAKKGVNAVMAANRLKAANAAKTAKTAKTANGLGAKATMGSKTVKGLRAAKGAKSSNAIKGVRAGKGLKTAKTARGSKTAKARQGAKGLRGSKTGRAGKAVRNPTKGAKVAKGPKGPKGARSTRGPKTGKVVNARKTGNGSRAAKGSKVTNAGKGAKAVRKPITKGAKATRGRKATKTAKSTTVSKVAKGSNGIKANRKAVAKGARGAKSAKTTKGSRAAKAPQGAKSARGGKGAKGKVAKGRQAASKGAKVNTRVKGVKVTKGAKPANSRKTGRAPKTANSIKGKSAKAPKARSQNSKPSKSSNQTGSRGTKGGASKAAAKPRVQRKVTKAAPKLTRAPKAAAAPAKKAGKRN